MVDDINPTVGVGSEPGKLTDVNGTLFFGANDGTNGLELWKSVAPYTTATMVDDINPTPGMGSNLTNEDFANVNGTVFFEANDGTTGNELWKSDGSTATQVANINPTGSSSPDELTNVSGSVFFEANDGPNGPELWSTVPPYTTATMVANINPAGNGDPSEPTNVNGTLFFRAQDGTTGNELWKATIEGPATVTPPATAQPTGQRAAALKKCKKKKSKKARSNCRKKAKKLPV